MKKLLIGALVSAWAAGCAAPVASQESSDKTIDSKSDKLILPPVWVGDGSACSTTLDHDRTFWPPVYVGPPGPTEWGNVINPSYGHPGCEWAQIIDYQIPFEWGSMNWQWAWIHIAPRNNITNQWECENSWTNIRIYVYPHHGVGNDGQLAYQDTRRGNWSSSGSCTFDQPEDQWMAVEYKMIRVVSQSGLWAFPGTPHYSYFVPHL